jgi:hypothetical protein
MSKFRCRLVFFLAPLLTSCPKGLPGVDGDIIINEIMYHPPGDLEQLQYVELFNRGDSAVDLSGWSFTRGIRYTFPGGTRIAAGGYVVVCRDLAAFSRRYGNDSGIGNFRGQLSHGGETIELSNSKKEVVDWLKYSDRGDWPTGADGYSGSLERICPGGPSRRADNWAASSPGPNREPGGTPGRKNESHSPRPLPLVRNLQVLPERPPPGKAVTVTVFAGDPEGVRTVILLHRIIREGRAGSEAAEVQKRMSRIAGDALGGSYRAVIEGQDAGTLVRLRVRVVGSSGAIRLFPAESEPRWTHSYFVAARQEKADIARCRVIRAPRSGERNTRNGYRGGSCALIYLPPGEEEHLTFDHVRVTYRKGGIKVYFQKDQTLRGMKTVNIISEGKSRYILSEALSYELYRLAGVPAELTEFVRLSMDGRNLGFHLLIEQPNESFLRRNGRNPRGNLYKLLWYGGGIVG